MLLGLTASHIFIIQPLGTSQNLLQRQDNVWGKKFAMLFKDGVHSTRLFGFDLEPEFIDIGCQLFRNSDKLQVALVLEAL